MKKETKITVTYEQLVNFRISALHLREEHPDKFSVFLNCLRHGIKNTQDEFEKYTEQENVLILKYVAKDEKTGFGIFSENGSARMTPDDQVKYNKELKQLLKKECSVEPYRYSEEKVPFGVTLSNIDFFTPFIFTEEQIEAWMTESK